MVFFVGWSVNPSELIYREEELFWFPSLHFLFEVPLTLRCFVMCFVAVVLLCYRIYMFIQNTEETKTNLCEKKIYAWKTQHFVLERKCKLEA